MPSVKGAEVRECLKELDAHKSLGPVGMCPGVLRELADVTARSLPIIFETSWRLEEIPGAIKKAIFFLISKKGRKEVSENYSQVTPTYNLYHR